eukprot:GHVU01208346.1.p1 GENE.GHVU01208346.1~~GHVU01208346.1.p1  ORF type:complete len:200 (-),score=18.25 GHVU01208346.1:173-772(-)
MSRPGGTAQEYTEEIVTRCTAAGINDKLTTLSADSEPVIFGGEKRGGTKNVYKLLKDRLGRPILGVNCHCHVLHNSLQKAADAVLPHDLPIVIGKLYQEFQYETSHLTALEKLCEEQDTQCMSVLSASASRWLSYLPAAIRLNELFGPLRTYFLSRIGITKILKEFFQDPFVLFWVQFTVHVCQKFHDTIKMLVAGLPL